MRTIKNLHPIIGKEIQTTNAEWVVIDMYERTNDYMIKVRLSNNTKYTVARIVNFRLLRYNEFESERNEWRMYNNQNANYVTLTKGLLDLKMFVGMLGGQLEHCYIKN